MGPGREINALQAEARAVADRLRAVQARIDQMGGGERQPIAVAVVDPARCVGCGTCEEVCPAGAIQVHETAKVDRALCMACGRCVAQCPQGAIALREG